MNGAVSTIGDTRRRDPTRGDMRQEPPRAQFRDSQQQRRAPQRDRDSRRPSAPELQSYNSRGERSKNAARKSSQRSDRPKAPPNGMASNGRPSEISNGNLHEAHEKRNNHRKHSSRQTSSSAVASPSTLPDSGYWPGTGSGSGSKKPEQPNKSMKPFARLGLFPSHSNLSMTSMPSMVSRSRMDSTQSSNLPAGMSGRSTPATTSASLLRKKPSFSSLKKIFKRNQPGMTESKASVS